MDISSIGAVTFDMQFVMSLLSIILIDIILAGDNAVVIALAVRGLPPRQRARGIVLGAGAAVMLRVVLTFFAAQLMDVSFVKLIGGVLIAWIAVKLLVEGCPEESCHKECKNVWQAVWTIIVADLVMSLDNVLAVAGASKGNLALLLFGLGLSIPLVVFTSNLLSKLMDRFPFVIYAGAAVLGKVSAEMILTDPWVHGLINPGKTLEYAVQGVFALGVILTGRLWMRWQAQGAAEVVLTPLEPEEQAEPVESTRDQG